jgi:CheY-like chemotaxis protein
MVASVSSVEKQPEMDGFEATAIRELERQTGKHIPTIAMTGDALKGDEARCLAAGMDGNCMCQNQFEPTNCMRR